MRTTSAWVFLIRAGRRIWLHCATSARHFQLEQHIAEGHFDRLPGLARELAGLPVDMFLVGGEASIRAAMQATDQIPIIKFDFLIHPLLYQPRRIPRPGWASRSQVCQS